ncbi:Histone acetyltransferase complex subunit [Serendipita sp. 399]|nr:Histone acetyltransferase complex subunit [Serendipita sp. 399]
MTTTNAGEEAAVIAQEFIISLDNVPAEVQFLLAEMRERECRITELQNRIQPRAAQYIRHASKGAITEKDSQTLERITADYDTISTLSDEKVEMAHRLKDLLIKHTNRLQVELGRITNPGEPIGRTALPSTSTVARAGSYPATTQPEALVYSGASRTPITNVVSTLKAEAAGTPVAIAPAPAAPAPPVPIVVEPPTAPVSAAPSPASAPPTKRRRIASAQTTATTQPPVLPAPSTPSAPRSSAPRPAASNTTLAPAPPSVPGTPASTRPRRQASAAATNISPTPAPASRNMSESTTMSSATTGGEDKDEEMAEAGSSPGENDGGDDAEGDGDGDDADVPYCVCQEKSYGEMIGCDNGADCPYQWFHVACVHVQKPLPNTWFCDYCTKKLGFADNTGMTQAQASGSERPARKRRR